MYIIIVILSLSCSFQSMDADSVDNGYRRIGDDLYEKDTLINGVKHVFEEYRHQNGTIAYTGLRLDRKKLGLWRYYSSEGKLESSYEYVLIRDTFYRNQFFIYDINGNINKEKSFYYSIDLFSDTINYGDSIKFKVTLESPRGKSAIGVVAGYMGEKYISLIDEDHEMEASYGSSISLTTPFESLDNGTLRGIIRDYDPDKRFSELFYEKRIVVIGGS